MECKDGGLVGVGCGGIGGIGVVGAVARAIALACVGEGVRESFFLNTRRLGSRLASLSCEASSFFGSRDLVSWDGIE